LCAIININQYEDLKNPLSFFTPENFTQKYSEPFLISSQKAKHCRLKKTNIMVVNQSHLDEIDNSKLHRDGLFEFRDNIQRLNNIAFDLTHLNYGRFQDYKNENAFILSSIAQIQSILDNWEILYPPVCNDVKNDTGNPS